jgi:CRP/FNR family transcriptional regulator, cyclic AMP receptor protein
VLYGILSGHAKTRSRGEGRVLRTGDYFGEIALIDGRPRSTAVVAMSHVQVMNLPPRSVLKLARQHPAITLTMLKNLGTRLRRLETQAARAA